MQKNGAFGMNINKMNGNITIICTWKYLIFVIFYLCKEYKARSFGG